MFQRKQWQLERTTGLTCEVMCLHRLLVRTEVSCKQGGLACGLLGATIVLLLGPAPYKKVVSVVLLTKSSFRCEAFR